MIPDALVVEGVAQLMGQSHHIAELAVKIGEDAALPQGLHPGAEGAAHLAVSGVEVDPGVVKGPGHHVG